MTQDKQEEQQELNADDTDILVEHEAPKYARSITRRLFRPVFIND